MVTRSASCGPIGRSSRRSAPPSRVTELSPYALGPWQRALPRRGQAFDDDPGAAAAPEHRAEIAERQRHPERPRSSGAGPARRRVSHQYVDAPGCRVAEHRQGRIARLAAHAAGHALRIPAVGPPDRPRPAGRRVEQAVEARWRAVRRLPSTRAPPGPRRRARGPPGRPRPHRGGSGPSRPRTRSRGSPAARAARSAGAPSSLRRASTRWSAAAAIDSSGCRFSCQERNDTGQRARRQLSRKALR